MTTIVLIFIGNILLLIPEGYIPLLERAIGFVLLVVSLVSVFNFMSSKKALIHFISLFFGLLACLFGFLFFTFDNLLVMMLKWLVGLVPFIAGIYGIYHALAFARRSGRKGWWILIVLSAFLFIFGGFAIFNPWAYSTQAEMQVIGGTLMYSALVSALRLIWIWPIQKEKKGE